MSDELIADLRELRTHGPARATIFLTCDNTKCAVQEIELRINEGGGESRIFQAPLLCCRCRESLAYHGLEG